MLVYRCTEEFYDIKEARSFLKEDLGFQQLKTPRKEPEQYMGKNQCAKLERMVASGKIIVRLFNVV
jgi:hypothetical protein